MMSHDELVHYIDDLNYGFVSVHDPLGVGQYYFCDIRNEACDKWHGTHDCCCPALSSAPNAIGHVIYKDQDGKFIVLFTL